MKSKNIVLVFAVLILITVIGLIVFMVTGGKSITLKKQEQSLQLIKLI